MSQEVPRETGRGSEREGESGGERERRGNGPPTAIIFLCTVILLSETAGSAGRNNARGEDWREGGSVEGEQREGEEGGERRLAET